MLKKINTYSRRIEEKVFLNKTEKEIFRILVQATKPMTIGDIWKKKHMNRLTFLYNLKKLEKRGFIKCDRSRKAHIWVAVHLETNISGDVKINDNKYISIDEAYDILKKSSQQKIIGIQGAVAVGSITKSIEQDHKRFAEIHTRQKLRQTIIDSIITGGAIDKIQHLPKEALLTHFGRPTILHVIPENNFISEHEIISDGKLLVITDHKTKKAIILKDQLIIKSVTALLEIIKINGIKKNIAEIYGMDTK